MPIGSYHNGTWTFDSQDSPAIDNGNPSTNFLNEPKENGSRINIGAFGGTKQASKTGVLMGDVNLDGSIDLRDVIATLQLLSGGETNDRVKKESDINNDLVIGVEEAIYTIRSVAALE